MQGLIKTCFPIRHSELNQQTEIRRVLSQSKEKGEVSKIKLGGHTYTHMMMIQSLLRSAGGTLAFSRILFSIPFSKKMLTRESFKQVHSIPI
jgi:hypothetical protein